MELDGSSIPTMPFSEKDMGIWTQRSSCENEAETEVTVKSPKLMVLIMIRKLLFWTSDLQNCNKMSLFSAPRLWVNLLQ